MKRLFKVIIIVLCSIVALLIIASLVISPVAKSYIESHGMELVGRNMKMDKLCINIFTGGVKVENFVIFEQRDSGKFVSFKLFETKLRLLPLISQKIIIKRVLLSGADVKVYQDGTKFSFDDIIKHFAADSTATPAPTSKQSPWEIGIYNIAIDHSSIYYKDLTMGGQWGFNNLNLKIPGVYFAGKSTDVGLTLDFTSGGALNTALKYDIEKKSYNLNLELKKFSLDGLLPYLQQSMNVNNIDGTLSAQVAVKGNTDHVMDFDLSGSATLSDMLIEDREGRKVISVAMAETVVENFNISKESFMFNRVLVDNVSTDFEVYKDGKNNFSDLMKPTTEPTTEPASAAQVVGQTATPATKKMKLLIGELIVQNSNVNYTDNSLFQPFAYRVSDITLTANNFNPSTNNTVNISATMQGQGTAHIKWIGNMDNMAYQNLTVSLSNINLEAFTPYSVQYFGYPIHSGNLTFISQNIVNNNMLNGTNKLDIYRCELDKKNKEVKPEYKVPLKVGLYVLKDKNGRINLDLPVKGDINSPEFSYKKIIIKTLVNVLVKVAATPVTFLADAMGISGNQLQSISINPLHTGFNSEQYAKIQELAQIVKSKPEFKLTLRQELNYNDALNSYAMANLKWSFYLRNNPNRQENIEMIDIDAVMNIDSKSKPLATYADSLLIVKGLLLKGNIQSKALSLFSQKSDQQIAESIMARNTLLYSHMTTKLQMSDTTFTVSSVPMDSMKLFKGKSCYAIGLDMVGDGTNEPKNE